LPKQNTFFLYLEIKLFKRLSYKGRIHTFIYFKASINSPKFRVVIIFRKNYFNLQVKAFPAGNGDLEGAECFVKAGHLFY
jgi:hypothetical protein